jgi:hypothetical protein
VLPFLSLPTVIRPPNVRNKPTNFENMLKPTLATPQILELHTLQIKEFGKLQALQLGKLKLICN